MCREHPGIPTELKDTALLRLQPKTMIAALFGKLLTSTDSTSPILGVSRGTNRAAGIDPEQPAANVT
jgi:hypothetical protein